VQSFPFAAPEKGLRRIGGKGALPDRFAPLLAVRMLVCSVGRLHAKKNSPYTTRSKW
jgi:hypothetical protein